MNRYLSLACQRLLSVAALLALSLTCFSVAAGQADASSAAAKKSAQHALGKSKPKAKRKVSARSAKKRAAVASKPSYGELAGLHATHDPLVLKSSVALIIDQDTREVLYGKNMEAVLPIASLTKLMTGLLVTEAKLPMDEKITIMQDDVDIEKGSRSRLRVGTTLTRGELMHLALMSSENRAAHALGRTYPGGMDGFVALMNSKAQSLGMQATRYVEPTGLSSRNQSSASDLAILVGTAYGEPSMRALTTSPDLQVAVGHRTVQFNTTNRLVKNPNWDIGLQKTGYISEAGRCLVMQARIGGRKLIMVFLDSAGKFTRLADAERARRWVEARPAQLVPVAKAGIG
ncbi:MAG: serine hydrolase [Betaproteobacteria bacterium]